MKKGFTLIELLGVLVLLAVIAVIATPATALLKIVFNFLDEKFKFFEYTKD